MPVAAIIRKTFNPLLRHVTETNTRNMYCNSVTTKAQTLEDASVRKAREERFTLRGIAISSCVVKIKRRDYRLARV